MYSDGEPMTTLIGNIENTGSQVMLPFHFLSMTKLSLPSWVVVALHCRIVVRRVVQWSYRSSIVTSQHSILTGNVACVRFDGAYLPLCGIITNIYDLFQVGRSVVSAIEQC